MRVSETYTKPVVELELLKNHLNTTGYKMPAKKTENTGSSISKDSPKRSPFLSEVSPSDKPWDKHRELADRVGPQYLDSEFERYAERMSLCSQILGFAWERSEGKSKLKLKTARFCRVRHCPICQWRRSLMWQAKAHKVLPQIADKYPTHRWLFATFTVRNCQIGELRDTLTQMNKGFERMSQRKIFPAAGWLRAMEVTRGKNGQAHPHFHCLLMVPPKYFKDGYIRQSKWVELWRDCMKLDYNPLVDIKALRVDRDPITLIPELLKYSVKESDLTADREWFIELTQQLHKMRAIATGGVLKEYLRELEQEPEDLIGGGDDEEKKITINYFLNGRNSKRGISE